jgi:hypothetical protein
MSEPWVPETQDTRLEWETRELPLCPECKGLARREILSMTAEGQQYGPWQCDLHGVLRRVEFETLDVPGRYVSADEEGAYDLSDPKHPRHHEVYADIADIATEVDR